MKQLINKYPRVGVGVIVKKGNKVLMGKRKGSHGEGDWNFPGGHLDFGEDVFTCARREVFEETGIRIKKLKQGLYTNDIFEKEGKHYITCFVIADYQSGQVKIMEPDKCIKWNWFKWEELPQPLFIPIRNLLKLKFNPFR
jgi:8-oxo-dGTP diphosphatase